MQPQVVNRIGHDRDLLRFYMTQTAFFSLCHKKAILSFNQISNTVALVIGGCLIASGGIGLATLSNEGDGLKVAIGVISLIGTFFLLIQRHFVPAVTGKLHEIAAREYSSLFGAVHDLRLKVESGEPLGKEELLKLKHTFNDIQGRSPNTAMFEARASNAWWLSWVFCCCGFSQVEGPGENNTKELADHLATGAEMPTMTSLVQQATGFVASNVPRGFTGPGTRRATNPLYGSRRNVEENSDFIPTSAADYPRGPSRSRSRTPGREDGRRDDVRRSYQ